MTGITSLISSQPETTGLDHPTGSSRPSQIRRRLRHLATAAVCVAGSAGALLATPAIAGATVNNNTPQYRQPPGTVYMLQKDNGVNGENLLEDHGNSMSDGGLIDTWAQVNAPIQASNGSGPSVTQANELWEFIPEDVNGGTLTQSFGELRNRQSGLCLDINGQNTQDVATVDQWDCVPGAKNEEWTAKFESTGPAGGGWVIQSEMDGAYLGSNTMGCVPNPDGTDNNIYARTNPSACTVWNVKPASYDYATNEVSSGTDIHETDSSLYGCLANQNVADTAYTMRQSGSPTMLPATQVIDYENYAYTNLSDSGDTILYTSQEDPETEWANTGPWSAPYTNWVQQASGTGIAEPEYVHYNAGSKDGQIMLYCDPPSTTS